MKMSPYGKAVGYALIIGSLAAPLASCALKKPVKFSISRQQAVSEFRAMDWYNPATSEEYEKAQASMAKAAGSSITYSGPNRILTAIACFGVDKDKNKMLITGRIMGNTKEFSVKEFTPADSGFAKYREECIGYEQLLGISSDDGK